MKSTESRYGMTRREARDSAFLLIFAKQINDYSAQETLELAQECGDIKINEYVKSTLCGVFDNLEEIDGIISRLAVSWSIKRISKVALAVLRLAVYEIKFVDSIPVSVSINEAVEIAKKYATKEDAAFINGILSSVAKENDKPD